MAEEKKGPNAPIDAAQSENDAGPAFYNVMPKTKNSGMVMPEIKSSVTVAALPKNSDSQPNNPQAENAPKTPGFFAKKKLYIFFIFLILALGAAAYFYLPKLLGDPYKTEDFLVPGSVKKDTVSSNPKKDWLIDYFEKEACDQAICGDQADPDRDGLTNLAEFSGKTDPNNKDSDNDGLADGDELNIFETNPLKERSGVNPDFTDSDYAKNGYNPKTDKKYSPVEVQALSQKMKQLGLHQPTITTLAGPLTKLYNFSLTSTTTASSTLQTLPPASTSTQSALPKDLKFTPEDKQDRDAQRSLTIKTFGIALIKYYDDNKAFPAAADFKQMYTEVKPYLKIATNANDPINADKYVYTYTVNEAKTDFTMSYFSETLEMLIKKTAKDARNDKANMEAAAFDDQRRTDLDAIRSALLVYSADTIAGSQEYVFPLKDKYKTSLVPKYISSIPKDPKSGQDYEYQTSGTFDTFTLKAIYTAPPAGITGYMCNQEECRDY